jgi:hypothetical protein
MSKFRTDVSEKRNLTKKEKVEANDILPIDANPEWRPPFPAVCYVLCNKN